MDLRTLKTKIQQAAASSTANQRPEQHRRLWSSNTSASHLAGRVVADDLLVQADADRQQLAGRGEGQSGARRFVGAVEHVDLPLGVGVPQDHGAAVRHAAQERAPQRRQPQVVDGLQ